jgi:UDP-glucuronate 4-epimerase
LRRDFTYIDDIVAGVMGCLDRPPADGVGRVFNIGNHGAETVASLVGLLEAGLGRRAVVRDAPRPAADVVATYADIDAIAALTGFQPKVGLAEGIGRFVTWFREWHHV